MLEIADAEERHIRLLLMREELRRQQGAERRHSLVLAIVVALTIGAFILAPHGATILVLGWLALTGRLLGYQAGGVHAAAKRRTTRR